jgi:hypothetical protein
MQENQRSDTSTKKPSHQIGVGETTKKRRQVQKQVQMQFDQQHQGPAKFEKEADRKVAGVVHPAKLEQSPRHRPSLPLI